MNFIAIDLGTTNIKVALYDDSLHEIAIKSENVVYEKSDNIIEFNADHYFETLLQLLKNCIQEIASNGEPSIGQIILTGQAESLILIDENQVPLRNGISWLDMRSGEECNELLNHFDSETCYQTTGQPAIIPTWPITKILWLKKNEPELFKKTDKFLLLKDFIQLRLTGILAGEYSIYNFSHYFDITKKKYWFEILEYCGVQENQLPPLIEPCTIIGSVTKEIAKNLGINPTTKVNVGTLDHFAGMVGTGNISPGIISESTGTVLSIATLINEPVFSEARVPCHYGPFLNSYVLLPVCESGGISLEWFKNQFIPEESYESINNKILKQRFPNELIFLPYITGVNAPDFNTDARGVFYGIQMKHNKYDFAYAVMEGIAHLLRINIDHIEQAGYPVERIISTGGGAKSDFWSQIKANITYKEVAIPANTEAACLGAAIIGAVSEGYFSTYDEAANNLISIEKWFVPKDKEIYQKKHKIYKKLYKEIYPVFQESSREF